MKRPNWIQDVYSTELPEDHSLINLRRVKSLLAILIQVPTPSATEAGFGVGSFGRFVETGTFLGQTVVALSAHFSELHSIDSW